MNKKIVDYYYNKILFYSKNNNYYDTVKSNEKNIIDSLNIIVDNNLDYLLTDSFLCYICSENMVSLRLFRMYFNKYELIGLLSSYIKSICNEYKNNDSDDYPLYIQMLDSNYKECMIKAFNKVRKLYSDYNKFNYRLYDVEHIIYIVLAYALINNRTNDLEELYSVFLNDPYKTLDDLYINGIRDPEDISLDNKDELLIDRVISKIERNKKREIKK